MFNKILVGLDGSPGSFRAMEVALALACEFGSALHVLSVIEHDPRFAATVGEVVEEREAEEDYVERIQDRARQIAARQEVTLDTSTVHGHAAHALAERTKTGNYDLLVIGQSGHSNVWGSFLGTTADKVSRHAVCSVLIVR